MCAGFQISWFSWDCDLSFTSVAWQNYCNVPEQKRYISINITPSPQEEKGKGVIYMKLILSAHFKKTL